MFIPTPISKIILALLIPISVATGLRAPAGSSKRQLDFATAGAFLFFLGMLFIPDSNWPVQLVLYAFGLGATIALWRALKRRRRERRSTGGPPSGRTSPGLPRVVLPPVGHHPGSALRSGKPD